ncbi:MAG: flagellar biosynthesis regulator FlaF [Pseudomonadota bacterium]
MPGRAIDAYKSVQQETMDGRELESSLLSKAAALLSQCQESWNDEGLNERLDTALRFNQRLWTFFQSELLEESNPLPQAVRQNLLSLSAFVDKRTFEVMAYPAPEKLNVLININRQIAAGLAPARPAAPEGEAP